MKIVTHLFAVVIVLVCASVAMAQELPPSPTPSPSTVAPPPSPVPPPPGSTGGQLPPPVNSATGQFPPPGGFPNGQMPPFPSSTAGQFAPPMGGQFPPQGGFSGGQIPPFPSSTGGQMPKEGWQNFGPGTPGFQGPGQQDQMGPGMQFNPGQQGGPQQGQFPGPQGQGQQGFQGGSPSQNDQGDKMRVQGMKRMVSQMEKEVTRVEKRFTYFTGKNVPVSQEAKDALAKVKEIVGKVKSAQTADDLDSANVEDVGEYMQTINDGLRNAETAAQFPKILKETEKQLAKFQTNFSRAQKKSQSLKIDVSSLLSDWKSVLDAMTQAKDKAKQLFSESQVEDAIEALRNDVMERTGDLQENERAFDMVSNTQRMLKNAGTELKTAERTIARLKAKKKDTSKLEEAVSTAKKKLDELKQLTAASPIDPEAFIGVFQELDESRQDYQEELGVLTGQPKSEDLPGFQNFQQVKMPQGFENFMQSSGPQSGGMNPGGQGMPVFQPPGQSQMNQPMQGGPQYMNQPGLMLEQYQSTLDEIYRKALELKAKIER